MNSFILWLKYPFARYLFFLVLGVTFYFQFGYLISPLSTLLITLALTVLYLTSAWLNCPGTLSGSLFFLWIFVFGVGYSGLVDKTSESTHLLNFQPTIRAYQGKVISVRKKGTENHSYVLSVHRLLSEGSIYSVTGLLILYIRSESDLTEGSNILVKGPPKLIPKPQNPYEFNYQQFMLSKGVTHRQFIKDEEWVLVDHQSRTWLKGFISSIRMLAEKSLDEAIQGVRERAVLKALLIGDKSMLEDETKSTYAETGAMHILAVSGLHVGIIYLMLIQVLKRIPVINRSKFSLQIIAVLLLWIFAGFTGFSPSVVRSVTMFSLYGVGDLLRRKGSIYNTVSLAAFMMIIIEPNVIFQVGFQFTFLAVFGIIYLQPRIVGILVFKNRIADWIWSLSSVGIAAQIAIFPLALHYFGIFPNYFLISNLIGIPLAIAAVNLGVILLIFYSSGLIDWVALILEKIVYWGNELLYQLSELPFLITSIRYFPFHMVLLTYALIGSMILFIKVRRLRYLVFIFGTVSGLVIADLYRLTERQKPRMIVYAAGWPCLDFFQNGAVSSFCTSVSESQFQYSILPARKRFADNGKMKLPSVQISENSTLVFWHGKRVLILEDNLEFVDTVKVDILVKKNLALKSEKITTELTVEREQGFFEYTID